MEIVECGALYAAGFLVGVWDGMVGETPKSNASPNIFLNSLSISFLTSILRPMQIILFLGSPNRAN